ncbi:MULTISPECIES: AraC family transcriptional regulator Rsp [unclassified Staphylococcus]|uniref:AraC family transcriptional regulator Rsp n=1 Tax=unclassified Staphylococcus TaxID=91994 RepID=UPI0008A9C82D|nr:MULTISPECIES: AraC family transcriptional regulator Rsp [unclassified Staphylococcus]OHP76977.1 AraC family transcriptional regulator [Staphylococcus sp. HMSC062D12]OHS38566.1 AraC family transcriptional regulator [Staphylococcus sp. HMSC62D11]
MTCTLVIHERLSSAPSRNINQIILLFSLTNELRMTINSSTFDLDNHIAIINHGDIFNIEQGQNIVELRIPLVYFYMKDTQFFYHYFDRHLLQSNLYIKSLLFNRIHQHVSDEIDDDDTISKIIQTLFKEAVVKHPSLYTPRMSVNHPSFTKALTFINQHVLSYITLSDVAQHCNISESYCSNLFGRYLHMNFKEYYTTLKLCRALHLLLTTRYSISAIATEIGFTSHTNFTNQFKKFLNFSPKQFRIRLQNIVDKPQLHFTQAIPDHLLSYINQNTRLEKLAIETTNIHIDHFKPQQQTQTATAFIRFNTFNELFHYLFNEYYNIDLSYLPHPAVLINDLSNDWMQHLNQNLLNLSIEKLFDKNISLALTIKSKQQFDSVYQMILNFLNDTQDYKKHLKQVKFMLIFDSASMTPHDIHLAHLKLKNKHKNIKYGLIIDGLLRHFKTVQETYDLMHRMNFHFYFIDIENTNIKNLLVDKTKGFTHTATHFENYLRFIQESQIPSYKFVYSHLSKRCFKYTNNGSLPLQLSDLVCHLTQLMKYGGGICYRLFEDDSLDIALFNKYGSLKPIMHLYQFVAAFMNEPIEITNNYMLSRKDGDYHFLIFNKINDRYLSDNKQIFKLNNRLNTQTQFIMQTLNHEHGMIANLLPQDNNPRYIEKHILKHLDRSNYPKTELYIQQIQHETREITLKHDEVKYLCIKPT